MRRMVGNIAALALGVAVSLAAGEALLRAVITLPLPRVQPEVRYLPHPVRRFTLAPLQVAYTYGAPVVVDARGFRVNGGEPTSEDTGRTLLALGDSFTFGLGVRDDQTWPAQLESRLRQHTTVPVSVVNAGTISYGVFQELDLLRSSGLATRPVMVIHALYWNDFMNAEPPPPNAPSVVTADGYFVWDQQVDTRGAVLRAASSVTSRSALFFSLRTVSDRFRNRRTSTYQTAYATMLERGLSASEWDRIDAFYRDLQAIARDNGFSVMAVIMPVNDIVNASRPSAHAYPTEARRRLDVLGIPYRDAFQLWESKALDATLFLPQGSDAHLTPAGYRILAEAVAGDLAGNLSWVGNDGSGQ
jgi:lysophospholipase L1-like esterase